MNNHEGSIPALTVENLNDDCLEYIFSLLDDIYDQLQVARVCERFHAIIANIWRRKARYQTLNLLDWHEWLPNQDDLSYFLNVMHDCVKTVLVENMSLHEFIMDMQELLAKQKNIYCLPNVYYFEDGEIASLNDEDINTLSEILPNLKHILLKESLTGRYIKNFQKLEQLHLYSKTDKEFELDNRYLTEICLGLKNLSVLDIRHFYGKSRLCLEPVLHCKNLTVLKANLNAIKPYLNDILKMEKLKQLNVMLDQEFDVSRIQNVDTYDFKIYETNEFFDILKTQSERIVGLNADLKYLPLDDNWPAKLTLYSDGKKIKQLGLCGGEFDAGPLVEYVGNMKSLEMLSCRFWEQLTNEDVLSIVEQCVCLVHLDVSYCANINEKLLYDLISLLKRQGRRQILKIYYFFSGLENGVKHTNYKFWENQPMIKLIHDLPPKSERGLSYVHRGYEFYFE